MEIFKNPATNPFTRQSYGGPPAAQGGLGLYLPNRGLATPAWVPSRWERFKITGWSPFHMAIPSTPIPGVPAGLWMLLPFDSQQFSAQCPIYFAIAGWVQWCNQPEGATITLYDVNAQQALTNPSGPDLDTANLGGTGKKAFFLKEFLFLDPGDEILATVSSQSENQQIGQVAAIGFQPTFPGAPGPGRK